MASKENNEQQPSSIIVLPLSEQPFFPSQTQPLLMNELPWMESLRKIGDKNNNMMGLFYVESQKEEIAPEDFSKVGTLSKMRHPVLHEHKIQFIAEGIQRVKVIKWLTDKPPFKAKISFLKDIPGGNKNTLKAYTMSIISVIKQLLSKSPLYGEEFKYLLNNFDLSNPGVLADLAINMTSSSANEKQTLLEQRNIKKRMSSILALLQKSLEISKIQQKIQEDINGKINKQQRQFFLQEQLKAIKSELGVDKKGTNPEIEKFKLRTKKLILPKNAKKTINEALEKLVSLESHSAEYAVTINYLEWLTKLPWGKFSQDCLNLEQVKNKLNQNHYGMDDVKNRILEFIAVSKLKGGVGGSIIFLAGPPGVGKTSIGSAIAEALNRKFYRFSVGGISDEAEIKGHRRTYIGAIPGKIIHALKMVQTQNPVILLDEIDKIGNSYAGNPASALLEVLDPEQNVNFLDHYLDTSFDLSNVLFICTGNDKYTVPSALLDRMEIIDMSGYITAEKIKICKLYLIPKQLDKNGINKSQLKFTDAAIRKIIEDYAREAGVRSLEKKIQMICRKVALKLAQESQQKEKITVNNIGEYLGTKVFSDNQLQNQIGTVTGLAWTNVGGDTLTIESSVIKTKNRGFKLTGQLGEVMQESAEIAYSFICSLLSKNESKANFFDNSFVHIHVPAGAIPKDGPSAGIAMATALLSLAKGKKPKPKIAMTGEITLTGQVLPIGGLREKIIAARRANILEVIIPFENKKDLAELPKHISAGVTFHPVKNFANVEPIIF